MPVNLNALIRYKTLDLCFKKVSNVATINYLIEHCSEAINEATGVSTGVSERTIRNDIRVLRSDILGFNAPIIVKNGIYSYEDKSFSIFDRTFSEIDLLKDIQQLLIDEFENISNKNLPFLIENISKLTQIVPQKRYLPKTDTSIFEKKVNIDYYSSNLFRYINKQNRKLPFWKKAKSINLKWSFILELI